MPKLWDILDDESKQVLLGIRHEMNPFDNFNPGPKEGRDVEVHGQIESVEEIDYLMQLTDPQIREIYGEQDKPA